MGFEDWLGEIEVENDAWVFWYKFYHGLKFLLENPERAELIKDLDLWELIA